MCRHHLELMLYPRKDSRQVSNHINEIEDITDGLRVSGSRRGLISMATEFDFGAFLLTENQFSPKMQSHQLSVTFRLQQFEHFAGGPRGKRT